MTHESKGAHYVLVFYPTVDRRAIDDIRRKYDPTVDLIAPHVTVLFPVPLRVGEDQLVAHIEAVLKGCAPFEVRFGGLQKSPDHWLLLTLGEGENTVRELYRSLYTGILAEFRRDDIEFVPHLGLGLFLKQGARYNSRDPQVSDLATEKYETALHEAKKLPVDPGSRIETLHLIELPPAVTQWLSGARLDFPSRRSDSSTLVSARSKQKHKAKAAGSSRSRATHRDRRVVAI